MRHPKSIQGQTKIASLLSERYGDEVGVTMDRRTIQRWRTGRFLPVGVESFPQHDGGNRYDVAKCCAWLETYIAARKKNPELVHTEEIASEAKARRAAALADREERRNIREAGEAIESAAARADLLGIIDRLRPADCRIEIHSFACDSARSLGMAPEVVAAFGAKLAEKLNELATRRAGMFAAARYEAESNFPAGE